MRLIALASIASLVFLPSVSPALKQEPEPYDVVEAYEVYAAILPLEWSVSIAHAKRIVIRAETKSYQMCLKPDAESAKVVAPAIADYLELNQKTWLLGKTIQIELPYELVFAADLDSMFNQGGPGWKRFYERYPDSGGWIELSAVGFNSEKTVAVVYMGHSCGGLCGGGRFHVLERKEGKWKPFTWKGDSCAWAS